MHFVLIIAALVGTAAASSPRVSDMHEAAMRAHKSTAPPEMSMMFNSRLRREYGVELVGNRITLFVETWGDWYAADVLEYDEFDKTFTLRYIVDDYTETEVDLTRYQVLPVDETSEYTHGTPAQRQQQYSPQVGATMLDEISMSLKSIAKVFSR
mmetsp:Transcript_31674/g.82945  ORF Transcript_31674/g.82945 Transcript_31674/m.82945 type:complete len:154 (-) Transcript_31674:314-775(-)